MQIVSFFRKLGRKLTPPGNRAPLQESGDQAGPDGLENPSLGGQRVNTIESWQGKP